MKNEITQYRPLTVAPSGPPAPPPPFMGPPQTGGGSFNFPRFLRFLKKHWWVPLLCVIAALCVQLYLINTEPTRYVSTARIVVNSPMKTPIGELYRDEQQSFFGTQIELMTSPNIRERATQIVRDASGTPNSGGGVAVRAFQVRGTSIIQLEARGGDPVYTQDFLGALINSYLTEKKLNRERTTESTIASLRAEETAAFDRMTKARQKLDEFRRQENLITLEQQRRFAGDHLVRLNQQLADMNLELLFLTPDRLGRAASGDAGTGADAAVTTTNSTVVARAGTQGQTHIGAAMAQIDLLKLELRSWSETHKPKHPKIIALNDRIKRQRELIALYRERSDEEMASAKERISQQILGVEEQIRFWEQKALVAHQPMAEFEKLTGELNRAENMFNQLANMIQTVEVQNNLSDETMINYEPPSQAKQVQVSVARKLILPAVLGLFIGMGFLYLIERADDRITSLSDLANSFDEPVVGFIPDVDLPETKVPHLLLDGPESGPAVSESYRNIRSALLFMASGDQRPKSIAITSAIPNEGKSTLAVNLAHTLAMGGSRVLLIDGDLRRGELHRTFGLPGDLGLIDVLCGKANLDLYYPTDKPNLFFLPTGKKTVNPGELFLKPEAGELLAAAREAFDYVIIDTPPVLAADDTTSLAPKADGLLFVVQDSFTKSKSAKSALDQLYRRGVNVLGIIYNRASKTSTGYSYYEYREYYDSPALAIK